MLKRVLLIGIAIVLTAALGVWLFRNFYYDREETIYIRRDSK